jgi:hypothetical protein
MCGRVTIVNLFTFEQLRQHERWLAHECYVQEIPDLSSDEREALMTGMCASCWADLFPTEDADVYYSDEGTYPSADHQRWD